MGASAHATIPAGRIPHHSNIPLFHHSSPMPVVQNKANFRTDRKGRKPAGHHENKLQGRDTCRYYESQEPGIIPTHVLEQRSCAMADITWEQARAVLEAAVKKAEAIGTKMDIAVVDAGANLKAFVRMDGAWLGSIDIAIKKARTARFFDMPTGEIGKLSQPGGSLYNIEHSNGGLITFPGGIPLKDTNDEIVGAIGVSGSTVENDHLVARAGAGAMA
jgi:uncharacterized protein GlcG (DUF336 family)